MSRDITTRAAQAKTEHDCQGVGHLCREAMIALADAVHDPARHLPTDGTPPSATDANRKLDAYIAFELPGSGNEEARRAVKAVLVLANAVQHRQDATPRDAALAAEMTNSLIKLIGIIAGRSTTAAESPLRKPERRAMTLEERERAVSGVVTGYPPKAIETLKMLLTDVYKIKIEDESGVMRAINKVAQQEHDERARFALQLIDALIDVEPGNETAWWAREARKTCLDMCVHPVPHQIAFHALQLLARAPEASDVQYVEACIREWPDDLYEITQPNAWVSALKGALQGRDRSIPARHGR